jgi:hypothetical protein
MKRILIYLSIGFFTLSVQQLGAQVLSVASGTDFNIMAGTVIAADSLDITPSANFTLDGTNITHNIATANTATFSYIPSVYDFGGTTNAFVGTLRFNYNNNHLNGLAPSGLSLDINNGSAWDNYDATTLNTTSNYLEVVVLGNSVSLNELTLGNFVAASYTWTGAYSTDWSTTNNWSSGTLPSANTNVVIPSAATNQPALSTNVTVKGAEIDGSLSINAHTLTINCAVSGSGSLKSSSTSSLVIGGTAGTLLFDANNNSLGNLTITGSATLGNALNLYGTFTPTSGTFNTGGYLTLKSTSITSSAVVGVVGGTVTGNVTVERYIPQGFRAYRDMAPEVYGAGSIFNNWQEGGSFTNSGYGIFITGSGATDAAKTYYNTPTVNSSNGLDYSINGIASAYNYNNGVWSSGITNTKTTTLDPFQGYRLLIRGDRGFNLESTPIVTYPNGLRMVDATTLRATGQLVTGTVTYGTTGVTNNTTGGSSYTLNTTVGSRVGFSYVANPYVCPVDWVQVYGASSGINGSYWYLDPTTAATGSYRAYNALTGSNIIYPDEPDAGQYIQAGQAVFVQAATSSPSVVFNESAKVPTSTKLSVFGATNTLSKIYVSLLKQVNGTSITTDGAAIAFSNKFGNVYGTQDALKFSNESDNIYINDKGQSLSIDGRLPATATDVVAFKIGNPSATKYLLKVVASNYINNGYSPLIYDAYKNTTTPLSGVDSIAFTVDTTVAASYSNRFSIIFSPSALPINSIVASATLTGEVATITWNTVGEKNESYFEVEKSTDAVTFNKINEEAAKNTATASYSITDNNVISTTYYRIKSVSEVGTVSYSNVAKLTTNNPSLTTISIYPNPVRENLNITLSNGSASGSTYKARVLSIAGKEVMNVGNIKATGSNITLGAINLASGVYILELTDVLGNKQQAKFVKE